MRNRFAQTFLELARQDERLVMIVADISPAGSMEQFRKEFPSRFINVGVAEQAMIGLAAGMAQRGFRPFCYTIASFALYRPFEFIRNDLAYQNLPVCVVGIGGGVQYSTLGATHHTMEDVAVASAIPNMTVLAPCDPPETEAVTRWAAARGAGVGPCYIRLGKAGEPVLTEGAEPWRFGVVRALRRRLTAASQFGGVPVALLGYGPAAVREALRAADLQEGMGQPTSVFSVPTLKPFPDASLIGVMRHYPKICVIEEHVPQGGLAQRVASLAFAHNTGTDLTSYALKDTFIHAYGSHDDLLRAHEWSV